MNNAQSCTTEVSIQEAAKLMRLMFSNEGPRGEWKCNNGRHYKILHAGSAGFSRAQGRLNEVCIKLSLPKPNHIQQPECEDCIKHYLQLTLSDQQWDEIEPARVFCQQYSDAEKLEKALDTLSEQRAILVESEEKVLKIFNDIIFVLNS